MKIEDYLLNTTVVKNNKEDKEFYKEYSENIRDYLSYCSKEELKELDKWADELYKEMKEEDHEWYERRRYDGKNRKSYMSLEELYDTLGEDYIDSRSYDSAIDNEADSLDEADLDTIVSELKLGKTAMLKLQNGGANTDYERRKQRERVNNAKKRGFVINGRKYYIFR